MIILLGKADNFGRVRCFPVEQFCRAPPIGHELGRYLTGGLLICNLPRSAFYWPPAWKRRMPMLIRMPSPIKVVSREEPP